MRYSINSKLPSGENKMKQTRHSLRGTMTLSLIGFCLIFSVMLLVNHYRDQRAKGVLAASSAQRELQEAHLRGKKGSRCYQFLFNRPPPKNNPSGGDQVKEKRHKVFWNFGKGLKSPGRCLRPRTPVGTSTSHPYKHSRPRSLPNRQ